MLKEALKLGIFVTREIMFHIHMYIYVIILNIVLPITLNDKRHLEFALPTKLNVFCDSVIPSDHCPVCIALFKPSLSQMLYSQ